MTSTAQTMAHSSENMVPSHGVAFWLHAQAAAKPRAPEDMIWKCVLSERFLRLEFARHVQHTFEAFQGGLACLVARSGP